MALKFGDKVKKAFGKETFQSKVQVGSGWRTEEHSTREQAKAKTNEYAKEYGENSLREVTSTKYNPWVNKTKEQTYDSTGVNNELETFAQKEKIKNDYLRGREGQKHENSMERIGQQHENKLEINQQNNETKWGIEVAKNAAKQLEAVQKHEQSAQKNVTQLQIQQLKNNNAEQISNAKNQTAENIQLQKSETEKFKQQQLTARNTISNKVKEHISRENNQTRLSVSDNTNASKERINSANIEHAQFKTQQENQNKVELEAAKQQHEINKIETTVAGKVALAREQGHQSRLTTSNTLKKKAMYGVNNNNTQNAPQSSNDVIGPNGYNYSKNNATLGSKDSEDTYKNTIGQLNSHYKNQIEAELRNPTTTGTFNIQKAPSTTRAGAVQQVRQEGVKPLSPAKAKAQVKKTQQQKNNKKEK